jgi:hypothetical protein
LTGPVLANAMKRKGQPLRTLQGEAGVWLALSLY